MGLIFFNLMLMTVTLIAIILLVFGITFIRNRNKDEGTPIKRRNGIAPTVIGGILTPAFMILDIYFLVREAEYGADVIGGGTMLIGTLFIWPVVLIVDGGVLAFCLGTGIPYMRIGKDRKTKEMVAIDHYLFGLLLVILGIAYIVCALGATVIPPSFQIE